MERAAAASTASNHVVNLLAPSGRRDDAYIGHDGDILRMQVIGGTCYQSRDMEMEQFRRVVMRAIARCQALLEEAQQPQEPPSASSSVGGGGSGHSE